MNWIHTSVDPNKRLDGNNTHLDCRVQIKYFFISTIILSAILILNISEMFYFIIKFLLLMNMCERPQASAAHTLCMLPCRPAVRIIFTFLFLG